MFVPDSTVSDLSENIEFLKKNSLLDRLDRTANLLSHCQIVLLGTSGYERFKSEGRLSPSGMFGFEGEVAFKDETVAAISELTLYACHYILREMEKEESPVFWQKADNSPVHSKLNSYIVTMFEAFIQDDKGLITSAVEETKSRILADLQKLLD